MMPSRPTESDHPWGEAATPFEAMGGAERVEALSNAFYDVIEEESPLLRNMLPASTANTRKKLTMYLSGWLGGPPLYEERWGHPRLRMRHMPFSIGETEAAGGQAGRADLGRGGRPRRSGGGAVKSAVSCFQRFPRLVPHDPRNLVRSAEVTS